MGCIFQKRKSIFTGTKKIFALLIISFNIPLLFSLSFWDDIAPEKLSNDIVNQMTDEELLSQTFMFGWAGAEPSDLLYQWVDCGLGSVKVFGWNTDDIYLVAKSVTSLQQRAQKNRFQIPLFVATDQEGGWIRHVKGDTAITPGNMAIGASGYPADSWYSAYYISREIKALGINMNFAPTVDLFTDHESSIIGTRSFGEDPQKSGILGSSFVSGSLAAGVVPTVKHFPGHGDTSIDSHGKLPVIDIDFETFKNRELVPFIYLIQEKVPAVMTGHLSFPQIDSSGAPASLSSFFINDLLRKQLGYEGLVITDDMMMVGATIYAGTMSNAFKMALEAGNDIILSSTTARLNEALWTKNLALMKSNPSFKETVKKAAKRVIKHKLDYYKSGNYNPAPLYPDVNAIDSAIPDREGQAFFLEQACRSITVEKKGDFPLTKENSGRIMVMGSLNSYFNAAKKRWPDAGVNQYGHDMGPNETQWQLERLNAFTSNYDTIIIFVANDNHVKLVEFFKGSDKKIIVLSTMSPELVKKLDWVDTILLSYSWRCEYSMEAMISALNGEYVPKGEKPYN